jgi:pilus assembly protein CpaF
MSGELWARFLVESVDGQVLNFDAAPGRPLTIGRDPQCDLSLPSSQVSRHHASIEVKGGRITIEDFSANGTLINDQLLLRTSCELNPASRIQIGPYNIRMMLQAPTPEMTPAPRPPQVQPGQQQAVRQAPAGTADVSVGIRRELHRALVDKLDLVKLERSRMNPHMLRAKVGVALESITQEFAHKLPAGTDRKRLIKELVDEALGLGPLEDLLADQTVTEVMVVDPQTIYIERFGKIELTTYAFTDDDAVRSCIERIVTPLGRRIDESAPMLDARLADGSRVNAVIRPLAVNGTCITIRKFSKTPFKMHDLVSFGTIDPRMALFLERVVRARKNVLISGGTGSGKTTLLNVLSAAIPETERIVTVEDSAELQLTQRHVVTLECRPANMEGKGEITIRDLVKNAMRMRPDRVIVGECRSGEALDMLQAMNTGHDGSMTTTHANSPDEALKRVETLTLMAGLDLPSRAVREQIATAIDVLVQQARFSDGTRRITSISEVVGMDEEGGIETREIFGYRRTGLTEDGKVLGEFYATGNLPSFLAEFIRLGLIRRGEAFL